MIAGGQPTHDRGQQRGAIRAFAGRLEEARADFTHAASLRETLSDDYPKTHFYFEALLAFADGDVQRAAEKLEDCLAVIIGRFESPVAQLTSLAAIRIILGEIDTAANLARDALTLAPDPGLQTTWLAIQHLAAVAALRGRCRTAARLTGVDDGWCDRYGYQRIGFERATYEILTKSLRDQLSTEALHALTTEGARLDFEQAVDEALSLS